MWFRVGQYLTLFLFPSHSSALYEELPFLHNSFSVYTSNAIDCKAFYLPLARKALLQETFGLCDAIKAWVYACYSIHCKSHDHPEMNVRCFSLHSCVMFNGRPNMCSFIARFFFCILLLRTKFNSMNGFWIKTYGW